MMTFTPIEKSSPTEEVSEIPLAILSNQSMIWTYEWSEKVYSTVTKTFSTLNGQYVDGDIFFFRRHMNVVSNTRYINSQVYLATKQNHKL